jgi:DNA-binding Lrp family transcriptional regulator
MRYVSTWSGLEETFWEHAHFNSLITGENLHPSEICTLISACMLIRTERGRFEELVNRLHQIPEVKAAFPVLGRYDVVVDLEASDSKQLGKAILKANHLSSIVFTETLPEVESV